MGEPIRMKRVGVISLFGAVCVLGACTTAAEDGLPAGSGPIATTDAQPSADEATFGDVSTDDTGGSPQDDTGEGEEEGGFVPDPDAGGATSQCDPWAQDCPDGEKCVAYRSPGGSTWDSNRCVPVVANPGAAGDPCTETGAPQSGEDDCDENSVCNYVVEGQGVCVAFCEGSAQNPTCSDSNTSCNIDNDGTRILCNPLCDPILQDCPDNSRMTCLVANGSETFNCELGWGDGGIGVGEECVFDNACLNGNLCIFDATAVPNCQGVGCCTPYCEVGSDTCPDAETECVPFYADGSAPPAYEHVGVCLIPE